MILHARKKFLKIWVIDETQKAFSNLGCYSGSRFVRSSVWEREKETQRIWISSGEVVVIAAAGIASVAAAAACAAAAAVAAAACASWSTSSRNNSLRFRPDPHSSKARGRLREDEARWE